jgi:hypothetical protein
MPFDPTKPVNNSPLSSAEMREQLGSLFTFITTDTARNPLAIAPLAFGISDPPTQVEVQAIYDKVNEILDALKRV